MRVIRFWQQYWREWEADCINFGHRAWKIEAFCFMIRETLGHLRCRLFGHKMIDDSYGTPETGAEAAQCERCGWGWHVTMY